MLTTGYNDMHREREEYEEQERKLADERLQEGLKRVRARCVGGCGPCERTGSLAKRSDPV